MSLTDVGLCVEAKAGMFELTADELRRVLALYAGPYQPTGVRLENRTAGFSGACVWELESAIGKWALRAMPAGQVNVTRLRGLHRLLDVVWQRGVTTVAVPRANLAGERCFVLAEHVWQLEPWLPGRADFHAQPTLPRIQATAHALAEFHRGAATFRPHRDERPWFETGVLAPSPGLQQRAQQLHARDGAWCARIRSLLPSLQWPEFSPLAVECLELFEQTAPRIGRELQIWLQRPVALQPCLRDIWHDHVLFEGERVTGLIDSHACRADHVATDLARLWGSFFGDELAQWERGLSAYAEVSPLTDSDRHLVRLFDATGVLLSGPTWLDWLYLERRPFADRSRIHARFHTLLQRLRALHQRTRPALF